MPSSLIDADSMLVVDVGSVNTRAMLFDLVEGRYRFLAAGVAPSTAGFPFHDVGEGVRMALDNLTEITGRILVDDKGRLIIPSPVYGKGVDLFAATISAGPTIKMVAVGLLDEVSVESIRRLAMTTYCGKVETISLTDRRRPEARIDAILRHQPNLVLFGGGTEDGASNSVMKLLEPVALACYLMPEGQRPDLLYAGNQSLQEEVRAHLDNLASVHFAPNVRPTLEVEQLDAAQGKLAEITSQIRIRQMAGMQELYNWAGGNVLPTAAAFGRTIRFLSKAHSSRKGVLGIDVGASATTIAAAFAGQLSLGVYPQYGLGPGLPGLLESVRLDEVTRWLPMEVSESYVQEYIYNKAIYPATIPATQEDLMVEQALARQAIRAAVRKTAESFPARAKPAIPGGLPWFEPIVSTGSVLTQAPSLAHAALMILDGLQPVGATTLVLDQNHLASALGSAASVNPLLSVQVLDSSAFLHLGTVVSPVGNARPGTQVLRVKLTYESGHETILDVKQGSLEVLPLPIGQTARLQLQPLHRYDVGMGVPGRGGALRVTGGALGVVIDARGRPIQLPDDPARRFELLKKWTWTLGG